MSTADTIAALPLVECGGPPAAVVPPEGRPASATARRWLLCILALGLLLRLWNIDYPAWKQPDEQNMVDRALLLGHLGPNPRWFAYPSLFLYLLFAVDAAFYAGGRLLGTFASPADFAAFYFAHPLWLHLVARGVTLACGMACLLLTYAIGRDGWDQGVGLAAAGLLAVSPLFVTFSRLAKSDILMAALLLLACWALICYLTSERLAGLWVASLAVGLAASAKYPAGLGVAWLVVAPWIRSKGLGAARVGTAALGLAALGFLAGTPYAVLDWSTFRGYFTSMAALMHGTWYGAEDRLGYTYYLLHAFPWALGWPATLLGIAGCGRWLLRGGAPERLLAGFALAFYGWMGYSRVASEHYMLPVLPILALAGADCLRRWTAGLCAAPTRWRPWALAALGVSCLLQPFGRTVRETLVLHAQDTREVAAAWIAGHLAPGTRILSEPYGPFLTLAPGRLDEMIAEQERAQPGRGMRLRHERAQARPGEGFWYEEMPLYAHEFLSLPAVEAYDLDRALAQGYTVAVLSSTVYDRYRRLPARYLVQNAFFDRVTRTGTLLLRVDAATPWCCPRTWNERLAEAMARRWGRPGPTLLVYRLAADAPPSLAVVKR